MRNAMVAGVGIGVSLNWMREVMSKFVMKPSCEQSFSKERGQFYMDHSCSVKARGTTILNSGI